MQEKQTSPLCVGHWDVRHEDAASCASYVNDQYRFYHVLAYFDTGFVDQKTASINDPYADKRNLSGTRNY